MTEFSTTAEHIAAHNKARDAEDTAKYEARLAAEERRQKAYAGRPSVGPAERFESQRVNRVVVALIVSTTEAS